LPLVVQIGFKLADAGGFFARDSVARLQVDSHGITLGSKALDGSRALGSKRLKAGAARGDGLDLGELSAGRGKSLCGFAVVLLQESLFGLGGLGANQDS
jgi:hypothetical protein